MIGQLPYLIDEICAGLEIYYTGRTGGQYLKTTFILCDDYTELTSKLFLLSDDPKWPEKKTNGRFKNYPDIQRDVQSVFTKKRKAELARVQELHRAMGRRRDRRNDFFHSTSLLDLSVTQRNCVEAFCDLLDYGELLFGSAWKKELCIARNLETLEILLRLERKSFSDPSITPKVNRILSQWPRNISGKVDPKGVHLTAYPEDLHLRLCVVCGGKTLKDNLAALL